MDLLKQVVAEWVLTNGASPKFQERVIESKDRWNIVEKDPMTVYRGQGHTIKGIKVTGDPTELVASKRPVLATSKSPESIARYAGGDCCIFEITLMPGTRYINVNDIVSGLPLEDEAALELMKTVRDRYNSEKEKGRSALPSNSRNTLLKVLHDRAFGADGVPAENEIMVYGLEGTLSEPEPIPDIAGKRAFRVVYTPPPPAGRGRTFRRKPKRMNKNGRRSARQSRHNRHRNP